MSRRRPRLFDETRGHVPRGITATEAAWELGLSESRFSELRLRLESEGFPTPDPITRRYDIKAIHHWLDVRSGLTNASDSINELDRELEAFARGKA